MLIVTFVTFALLNLLPGDVSLELLGSDATPSAIARVRSELRLDDPLVVRYMRWLGQALQGDLGRSFITGEPVMAALARSSPGVAVSWACARFDPCSLGQSRPAAQLSVGRSRVSNGVTKRYEGLGSSALSRPLRDESEVNSKRSTELREGPGEYPPGSVPSAMRHFLPVVHEPVRVVPTSAAFRDAVHVFSDVCRRA